MSNTFKRLDILTESDLLDESHYPVLMFNLAYERDFAKLVTEYLANDIGFGVEYGNCTFPGDLDDYDLATTGTFDGVEFGLGPYSDDDIVLDYKTFYYYLKLVCDRFLQTHPQDEADINKALSDFCLKHGIT